MTKSKIPIVALSGYGSSEFEDLEVTESTIVMEGGIRTGRTETHPKWLQILAYVLLLLLGIILVAVAISVHDSDNWVVAILFAGIALGFGAATLFYRRFIDQQSLSLKSELQEAKYKADALAAATARMKAGRPSAL